MRAARAVQDALSMRALTGPRRALVAHVRLRGAAHCKAHAGAGVPGLCARAGSGARRLPARAHALRSLRSLRSALRGAQEVRALDRVTRVGFLPYTLTVYPSGARRLPARAHALGFLSGGAWGRAGGARAGAAARLRGGPAVAGRAEGRLPVRGAWRAWAQSTGLLALTPQADPVHCGGWPHVGGGCNGASTTCRVCRLALVALCCPERCTVTQALAHTRS